MHRIQRIRRKKITSRSIRTPAARLAYSRRLQHREDEDESSNERKMLEMSTAADLIVGMQYRGVFRTDALLNSANRPTLTVADV